MKLEDLGTMKYRDAWAIQERVHAEVLAGADERLLLVEHPPVITFGRRAEVEGQKNLVASREYLDQLGVELVQSDRGGDITFHGPGQIVAYPIIRLNDHRLSVGGYVRTLEEVVIATLKHFDIAAERVQGCVGIWVKSRDEGRRQKDEGAKESDDARCALGSSLIPHPSSLLSKICAIGVRIRRGVSLHGVALNVTTDLRCFKLIVPCGLVGKSVTSMQQLLGDSCPPGEHVKQSLIEEFMRAFEM